MAKQNIFSVIELAMAVIKDAAVEDCLRRVENAQRELLLAEADKNREKGRAIIRSIAKIDIEQKKLEITYSKIKDDLGDDGKEIMDNLIRMLNEDRARFIQEKNRI